MFAAQSFGRRALLAILAGTFAVAATLLYFGPLSRFAHAQTPTNGKQGENPPGKSPALVKEKAGGADSFAGGKAGEEKAFSSLKMKFCWCPAGKFTMGSPAGEKDRIDNEAQVSVTLSRGFWLGKFEIPQGAWKSLMSTEPWSGNEYVKEGSTFPATYVSHDDATKFCEKLTEQERKAGRLPQGWEYRLPTEAQWEYACRAGSKTRFHFGDDEATLGTYAWFRNNAHDIGGKFAHEVGQKRPNDWGLHDMHGNVWEWCRDWYKDSLPGGTDPEVTERGSFRVFRGGCWNYVGSFCRSASRYWGTPGYRGSILGFRLALVQSSK